MVRLQGITHEQGIQGNNVLFSACKPTTAYSVLATRVSNLYRPAMNSGVPMTLCVRPSLTSSTAASPRSPILISPALAFMKMLSHLM